MSTKRCFFCQGKRRLCWGSDIWSIAFYSGVKRSVAYIPTIIKVSDHFEAVNRSLLHFFSVSLYWFEIIVSITSFLKYPRQYFKCTYCILFRTPMKLCFNLSDKTVQIPYSIVTLFFFLFFLEHLIFTYRSRFPFIIFISNTTLLFLYIVFVIVIISSFMHLILYSCIWWYLIQNCLDWKLFYQKLGRHGMQDV